MDIRLSGDYFEIRQQVEQLFPDLVSGVPAKLDSTEECEELLDLINDEKHYSRSKTEFFLIKDMEAHYITNVLRNYLDSHDAKNALTEDYFKSLVLNLAEKIKEQVIEDSCPF